MRGNNKILFGKDWILFKKLRIYLRRKGLYEDDYKILLKGIKKLNKQKDISLCSMETVNSIKSQFLTN